MKKFHYSLDRVLDWRRTQARMEHIVLERMLGELRQIEGQAAVLRAQREASERAMIGASSSLGSELLAFNTFRTASAARATLLERNRSACMEKIRTQREVILSKEKEVSLLEKLREDRLHAWSQEQEREIDQQASEAHLGRRNRR
jgi:flagellar biosynthesis chaperone FliJ